MPHFESAEPFGEGLIHFYVLDLRRRRALVELVYQGFHRRFVAFEMGFDRAVLGVADPAAHAELARLLPGPGAEENSLDAPGHPHAASSHGTDPIASRARSSNVFISARYAKGP